MDVPPLRWPRPRNVLRKTYMRVKWYFMETLPLFLLASVLIWVGIRTGVFAMLISAMEWPVGLIGLPAGASKVFLFGFFRRDFGAAGLFDLAQSGALNGVQLVVATIALTLFLPCIAQLLINVKERGWKAGAAIAIFVLVFSFSVAWVVNITLNALGVVL
jgi:ferrous iron transport protein B